MREYITQTHTYLSDLHATVTHCQIIDWNCNLWLSLKQCNS